MPRSKITSVVRSLEILECFKLTDREWTLKALVDELDLPQTTVFRQVSNLVESGYLQQDPVRKSYQIGPKLLLLSSASSADGIVQLCAGDNQSMHAYWETCFLFGQN